MKKNFMAIASLLIAAMLLVVSCAPEANVEGKVEDGLVDAKLNVAFGKAVNVSAGNDAKIIYKYSLEPQWDALVAGKDPYGKKSNVALTDTDGRSYKLFTISDAPSITSLGKVTPGLWKVVVDGYLWEKQDDGTYSETSKVLSGFATIYFGHDKNTVTVFVAPVTSNDAKGKISINLQMQDLERGDRIMYKLDNDAEYTAIERSEAAVVEGKAAHSYVKELDNISTGYHTISFKIEHQDGGITRSFYLLKGNNVSIVGSVTPSKFAEEAATISVLQLAQGTIALSGTTAGTTTTETSYKLGSNATATATFTPPSTGNGITSVVMKYDWYWGPVGAESVLQNGVTITDSSDSINIKLPSDPGRYTLSCLATCTVKYENNGTVVTHVLKADATLQEFLVD